MRRSSAVAEPPPVPDGLERKLSASRSGATDFVNYHEIRRICQMPLVFEMDSPEYEAYCRENILASAYDEGFRLFYIQAEAVSAWELYNGLFAPIGVGWGKTLICLMIANKAYLSGTKKIMLLVPPEVLSQLVKVDIPWARTRVPINYPIYNLGGRDTNVRKHMAASGKRGVYIVPYSLLSVKDTVENIEAIDPSLIICDEVHNLRHRKAARTSRLMSLIESRKPAGAVLSGTITSKSIKDYYHLIKWCLHQHSPLPLSTHLANDWATVLDSVASEGGNDWVSVTNQGPLLPLIDWARTNFPKAGKFEENVAGFRKAYESRMSTAPGVVSSGDSQIGTSLTICNRPVVVKDDYPGYQRLQDLGTQVSDMWLTPNGDEIDHAIHLWKWLNEIYGAGFYNELLWPEPEVFAQRRGIGLDEATDILVRAKEHHSFGQIYAKSLRQWLEKTNKPGLDTPFLVGSEMSRNGAASVGSDLYDAWRNYKDCDFEGRPDRDSRAVRVCDFKIQACVQWAKQFAAEEHGCIIWYYHQAIGDWIREELEKQVPTDIMHCKAGERFNTMIRDVSNRHKIVIASMTAHGTGKNLQHFFHQYVMQWPRPAVTAEQFLGRTHRNGQMADDLPVFTNITSLFDQLNFAACLNDSLYIHQTTGNRQKLIYCNYDPLPKIFPSSVLRERGLDPTLLNRQQQKALNEKFGVTA